MVVHSENVNGVRRNMLEGFVVMDDDDDDENQVGGLYNDDDGDDGDDEYPDPRHRQLLQHPRLWSTVGVAQTLLSSGVIFGWASLLPVLRSEGVDYTPEAFSLIFTAGAIGNYLTTLLFGLILDNFGPRITGCVASVLYGIGLILCSNIHKYTSFSVGFFLIGFAGPGIQMPTLHLANLFSSNKDTNGRDESGGPGAAFCAYHT